MARDDPITYEELSAEHKQRYDEIKTQFESDLMALLKGLATMVSGGKGFHPKVLLME
jgi:hypothetical protein